MPTMNRAPLWYPPQFPLQGRLPTQPDQVRLNLRQRTQAERDYQDSLSLEAGRRASPPCCKSLNITLCFDGTGNNLNNDLYESGDTPHPTNIARMFRASIGAGHVGGTSHRPEAAKLTDAFGAGNNQYFKYYIPGVGTPFAEVNDLDDSTFGLALAGYGEERLNWGLLMIIDALRRALGLPSEDHVALLASVNAMGTVVGQEGLFGPGNRKRQFMFRFLPLLHELRIAMAPNPGHCQLLGLQLYVYGFSRGAAAARAFVSWLNAMLSHEGTTPCLAIKDVKLPISVEYLGLLDTVASVGVANIIWGADGHMSWADGNQHIPDSGLVKRCLHIVASHEQRLCFPLDSIRRENGGYPANSLEVLHPGVHSDQGGGYPPGDQGKAYSTDSRAGDSLLLSQIALNDLYADAFASGAPLKVPENTLPVELKHERWRAMIPEVALEFAVAPLLINRFNAWRQVTLGLSPTPEPLPADQVDHYQPIVADQTIEQALRTQMAWITAWRIDRYGFESFKKTDFYREATNTHADPKTRRKAESWRDQKQVAIEKDREKQLTLERLGRQPVRPMKPGLKAFDPDMAQTQLSEAAQEFAADYRRGRIRTVNLRGLVGQALTLKSKITLQQDYDRLKSQGQALVGRLFPPPLHERNHLDENKRGNVDESRNATEPEGLLRALFDDQVHDSRAWFLYWTTFINVLDKAIREPFSSYLRDRAVFFGDTDSRTLVVYDQNDQPVPPSKIDLGAEGMEASEPPPPMDSERLSQAQTNMQEMFKAGEVNDAAV